MPNEIALADGPTIAADLVVWAAGVMAPAFLSNIDGLETNANNQLIVGQTLQTTRDDTIFAIGDWRPARGRK
jgi:NADH:ubiquinone reductase (H+-translocating)